jgi:large subunit ribosomal protein L35
MRERAEIAVTKLKLKTHKGAKKRFKITATGKLMRAQGMKSHFRRRKAPRVKRQFDRMQNVDGANRRQIKQMLPNG